MATTAGVSFTIDASGAKQGAADIATAIAKIQASLGTLSAEAKKIQAEINSTFTFSNIKNAINEIRTLESALAGIKFPNLAVLSDEFKTLSTQMSITASQARVLAAEVAAIKVQNHTIAIQGATAAQKEFGSAISSNIPFLKSMAFYFTAEGILKFGEGVYKATNQFQSFSAGLHAVADDSNQAKEQIKFVSQTVLQLGLDLGTTQDSFQKFFASAKLSGASVKDIDTIFADMAQSMTVFGLSAARQQYVWLALEQMFNKGTVQMQELKRQLGDQLPAAFEIFAKSMGKSTAELTKMITAGEVGSDKILGFAEAYKEAYGKGLAEAMERPSVAIGRLNSAIETLEIGIGNSGAMKAFAKSINDLVADILQVDKATGQFITDSETGLPKLTKRWEDIANSIGSTFTQAINILKPIFEFIANNIQLIGTAIELYLGNKALRAIVSMGTELYGIGKAAVEFTGALFGISNAAKMSAAAFNGMRLNVFISDIVKAVSGTNGWIAGLRTLGTVAATFFAAMAGADVIWAVVKAIETFSSSAGTLRERLYAASGAALEIIYQMPILGDAIHYVATQWLGIKDAAGDAATAQQKADPQTLTDAYKNLSPEMQKVVDALIAEGKQFDIVNGQVQVHLSVLDNLKKEAGLTADAAARFADPIMRSADEATQALKNVKNGYGSLNDAKLDKANQVVTDLATGIKNSLTESIRSTIPLGQQMSDDMAKDLNNMEGAVDAWAKSSKQSFADAKDSAGGLEDALAKALEQSEHFADQAIGPGGVKQFSQVFTDAADQANSFFKTLEGNKNAVSDFVEGLKSVEEKADEFSKIKLDAAKNQVIDFAKAAKEQLEDKATKAAGTTVQGLNALDATKLDRSKAEIDAWAADAIKQLGDTGAAADALRKKFEDLLRQEQETSHSFPGASQSGGGKQGLEKGGPSRPGMLLVGENGPEILMTSEPGYVFNNSQTKKMLTRATGGPVPAGYPTLVGENGVEAFVPGGQFSYSRSGVQPGDASSKSSANEKNDMAIKPKASDVSPNLSDKDIWKFATDYKSKALDPAVRFHQVTKDQETVIMGVLKEVAVAWQNYKSHGPAGQVGIATATNGIYPYFHTVRNSEQTYPFTSDFVAAAYGSPLAGDISDPYSTSMSSAAAQRAADAKSKRTPEAILQRLVDETVAGTVMKDKQASKDDADWTLTDWQKYYDALVATGKYRLRAYGYHTYLEETPTGSMATLLNKTDKFGNRKPQEITNVLSPGGLMNGPGAISIIDTLYPMGFSVDFGSGWLGLDPSFWNPKPQDDSNKKGEVGSQDNPVKITTPFTYGYHNDKNGDQVIDWSHYNYATGGEFTVGMPQATTGDDSLVQFMAKRGEKVKISQASQVRHGNDLGDDSGGGGRGGPKIEMHLHGVTDFNSFRRSERQMLSRMNKALDRARDRR